jgi:hypothetical protein
LNRWSDAWPGYQVSSTQAGTTASGDRPRAAPEGLDFYSGLYDFPDRFARLSQRPQTKILINTAKVTLATTPLHRVSYAATNISFNFRPQNLSTPLAPLADNGFAGLALPQAAAAVHSAMPASPGSSAFGGGAFFPFSDLTRGDGAAVRPVEGCLRQDKLES